MSSQADVADREKWFPNWAVDTVAGSGGEDTKTESETESESGSTHGWSDGLGLRCFRAVELFAVATGGLVGVVNFYLLFTTAPFDSLKATALRLFGIAFCVLIVVTELDLGRISGEIKAFENWACRGVFYCFVGSLTLSTEEDVYKETTQSPSIAILSAEAYGALAMFVCGTLYIGMGLTCRQQVKELMLIEHRLSNGPGDEDESDAGGDAGQDRLHKVREAVGGQHR